MVRPSTAHDVATVTQVNPPGVEVTVYDTAAPPSETAPVHDTVTERSSTERITTSVAGEGIVDGTTAADAVEAAPVPDAFVAVTLNVYEVPFVRPVTVHEVVAVVHANEPGDDVTVYELIEAPPLLAGAVHDTTDWVLAAPVALTAVGAPGTVDGTTAADALEAAPKPDTFVAVTVNV